MNSSDERVWTERYTDFKFKKEARPARVVFQRDRARVIHSASFRRLQAKTQIFGLNESDFYRTRLTHSMEVAQIGSGLVEQLHLVEEGNACEAWLPSFYLIEAICLAHDLGHPPFGHGGEVALNYMMRAHGGFEGNAQTLRILAKLGEYTDENGIDLSRRATLGVLKYPTEYGHLTQRNDAYMQCVKEPDVLDFRVLPIQNWIPPKCSVFAEERGVFNWVISPFSDADKTRFMSVSDKGKKFFSTNHESFDTTIMELADDIAYGIHDLEDAVAMRMVPQSMWQSEVMEHDDFIKNPLWDNDMSTRLFSHRSKDRKHAISHMVGIMVESIYVVENNEFEHPLLRYQATLGKSEMRVLNLLKTFVYQNVITLPEVKGMEYKGQLIILELFKSLRANPKALLPRNTFEKYDHAETESAGQRVIADYIAGMTNTYAARLYAKLFLPLEGSIFDRL